jgi:hypothetical protein
MTAKVKREGEGYFEVSKGPAADFLIERAKLGDSVGRALIELLRSDVPLDPDVRRAIAWKLERLYFPPSKRELQKERGRNDAEGIKALKAYLRQEGVTATQAEECLAEIFGISVEGLRQRLKRGRKSV